MAYGPSIWLACILLTACLCELTESIERCKNYPDPKNGQVVCDSLFRLFCTPECDDGFTFEFKPAVVYMCGPITGEWFTYPERERVPWPNCVRIESSKLHAKGDEMAVRRAQIAAKMHGMHLGISPPKNQQQLVQPGQPNARYLQMFNYIQRAQQQYDNKQVGLYHSFDTTEQQPQLESRQRLQQKQTEYLQLQQQWQMGRQRIQRQNYQPGTFQNDRQQPQRQQLQQRHLQLLPQQWRIERQTMHPQKLMKQSHNYQPEIIKKERQQRQAIDSAIIDKQINVQRGYQNSKGNLQTDREVSNLHTASLGRTEFTNNSKIQQIPFQKSPSYTTIQSNYEEANEVTPVFHWSNYLQVNSRSRVPLTQAILQSSQSQNRILEQNKPTKPREGLATVSQERAPLWQVSNSALNSQQDVKSHPWGDNQNVGAHVVSQPTNQIAYTGLDLKLTNQSGRVDPIGTSLVMLSKTDDTGKGELVPKSASYKFQKYYEDATNFNSNRMPNTTSKAEEQANVADEQDVLRQKKLTKKEKLFYFPIKRDTLVQIVLSNLQEKFKSVDEKRSINSSQKTSINEENVTKSVGTQVDTSNDGFRITPHGAPASIQSTSETFDSSRNILKKFFEKNNETSSSRMDSVYAPKNLNNYNFSTAQTTSDNQPLPSSIVEKYKPI